MTMLNRTCVDGTDGAIFSITNEVKIGRDKNSDIRLKIPSVSRNHARVYQDENGNVSQPSIFSDRNRSNLSNIDASCSVSSKIFQIQILRLSTGNSSKISYPWRTVTSFAWEKENSLFAAVVRRLCYLCEHKLLMNVNLPLNYLM